MPLLLTLLAFARRAFLLMFWFAVATLLAGVLLWVLLADRDAILTAILAGVLLVAPGLILLHAVTTLRGLGRAALGGRGASPSLSRTASTALLFRPWYWSIVLASVIAGFVLLPAALVVTLLSL